MVDPEKPAHYPNAIPGAPEKPGAEFMRAARVGDALLLLEPGGKTYRAVVAVADPFACLVSVRTGPYPPVFRSFALNGFELGVDPGFSGELRPLPSDKADRLRRRELFFELCELLQTHGEELLPVATLEFVLFAVRRYARQRSENAAAFLRDLNAAYRRVTREMATPPKPTVIVWANPRRPRPTDTEPEKDALF